MTAEEERAGEHVGRYAEMGYMIDGWRCSCGWESHPYFDGAEYARDEWKRHVAAHLSQEQSR